MACSVVIFDLDDTLIEEERTAQSSFNEVVRQLNVENHDQRGRVMRDAVRKVWHSGPHHNVCIELGIASWEGLWSTFEGNHPVLDGVKAWMPIYRLEAWQAALAALGIANPGLVRVAQDAFVEAQSVGHPLIEGAAQTVGHLSAHYRQGLLTNGSSDVQRHKLKGTGLDDRFHSLCISGETGVGKPTLGAFAEALSKLNVQPEDAVMVGDNWDRDIVGAVGAGMSAVWIASDRAAPEKLDGVTVIGRIEELPDVLREA